jgi:hypothetical protein
MTPRRFRQALSLALAAALSGAPSVVSAAAAQAPPPARSTTPIADAAVRAAAQMTETRTEMPPGLKWTGFGLVVGGGSLIALGAVIDENDCFDFSNGGVGIYHSNYAFDNDCQTARKASYLAGGIMAGVGVGLLIMAQASRRPVSPTVTMQHGRMLIQQRVRF